MLSVASRPVWRATLRSLRDLTRVTVAALALAVGLGGTASAPVEAPQATAAAGRPVVVNTHVEALRPETPPAVARHADTAAPTIRPTHRHAAAPADALPAAHDAARAIDPGRGEPGRRGPPLA